MNVWPWRRKANKADSGMRCWKCLRPIYLGDQVEWFRRDGRNQVAHKEHI